MKSISGLKVGEEIRVIHGEHADRLGVVHSLSPGNAVVDLYKVEGIKFYGFVWYRGWFPFERVNGEREMIKGKVNG